MKTTTSGNYSKSNGQEKDQGCLSCPAIPMSGRNGTELVERLISVLIVIFRGFAFGMLQSLNVVTLYGYLRTNANLRRIFRSCLIVNVVFFSSLWVAAFFSSIWAYGWRVLWGGASAASGGAVWNGLGLLRMVWFKVFDVMWVLPMYALTQALGVRWYSALYTEACVSKKHRTNRAPAEGGGYDDTTSLTKPNGADVPPSFKTAVVFLSEIIFKAIVTALCAFLAVIVETIVPAPIGPVMAFMLNSCLYAFCVFDYRFSSQYVWDHETRQPTRMPLLGTLKYFEKRWAYFLGFGATQTVMASLLRSTWIASSWFSVAAFTSVVFGAHIILSVEAKPNPPAPFAIPVLSPFFAMCGVVVPLLVTSSR
ncbi:hypothetical protein DQ04_00341120 [Trypanosoma grayi]|uniref:hypothetical protein n=1 Tax=Trypanosoma grayi TaxID=71804 RepID=UPI0004F40E33|nr:hypothetical protein DQ04_00341120 [Trypanosoma grayi]KEG14697.1 hypothetical protein DQ04_00341120 [Trypanosoma grayi]